MKALVLCLVLAGCGPAFRLDQPLIRTHAVCLSRNLDFAVGMWSKEVEGHLPGGAVVVMSHGTDIAGQWYLASDRMHWMRVEDFAAAFHAIHPRVPLVVIACNDLHLPIRERNVYYPRDAVWSTPNRFATFRSKSDRAKDCGSFEQLSHNE